MNKATIPTLAESCVIVKAMLDDDSLSYQTRAIAIEKVARMETHNSIKKDELIAALRWLFDHYDFTQEGEQ